MKTNSFNLFLFFLMIAFFFVGMFGLASSSFAQEWEAIADLSDPNRRTINFDKLDTEKCNYRLKQDFYFVAEPGGARTLDTSDYFPLERNIQYGPYIFPQNSEKGLSFSASRERIVRSWTSDRSEFIDGSNPDLSPNELLADRSTAPGTISYAITNRGGKSKLFFIGRYKTIEEVPNAPPQTANLRQVYELDSESVVSMGEDSITYLLQQSCPSRRTFSVK